MRTLSSVAIVLLLLPLFAGASSARESEDAGLWTSAFASGAFRRAKADKPGWRWSLDLHARFLDETDGFAQAIVRPGVGYKLSERSTMWLGYAWIRTNRRSGSEFDEHRVWQQWSWRNSGDGMPFSNRLRLEQRAVRPGAELAHRVRERMRFDLPSPIAGVDFIVHDEIFLGLNHVRARQKSGLDQNRFFAGVGFDVDRRGRLRLEVGYLNQYFEPEMGTDQLNHLLSVNLVAAP